MRVTFYKAFFDLIHQMAEKVEKEYSVDSKEAINIAGNIIRVEVSVYLLRLLKPKEDKIDAISYLFYSLVQPSFLDLSPIHKRYLANLHALLPHWKAKRSVRNQLRQYSQHNRRRLGLHVEIDWEKETFVWHDLPYGGREKAYERILGSTLEFRQQRPSYFPDLKGKYYDHHDQSYRYFSIPAELKEVKRYRIPFINCNHVKDRSPIVVSFSSLQESAKEMDKIWQKTGLKSKRWANRLENIKIRNIKQRLGETLEIRIEGTQHWVGPLSVGKSSLLEVLSYYMVQKRKEKVTLIVPNISEMFRLVDMFHLLGINAVPIMSDRQRQNHIQQYLQSFGKEDLQKVGLHIAKRKSFRYLSASCLLRTMETDSSTNLNTIPPCFQLQRESDSVSPKRNKKYVCPFFSTCDYHRMYQEMEKADIYVTNINSLLISKLPSTISKEKMLTLEFVLRRSSLVLVDEADNVQSISDGNFVPHEELTSDMGGWLARLAGEVRGLLDKNPAVQWQDEEIHHWLTNVAHAQVIQTEIRFLLENVRTRKAVRSFIGNYPFTGKGLLAKLSLCLAGIPIQQNEDGIHVDDKELTRKREIYEELTDLFFEFYQAYREDEEDNELEGDVKRLKEIVEIADRFEMSNRAETFLKEIAKKWDLNIEDWEEMKTRFLFVLRICSFEKRLYILTHGYAHVADILEVEAVKDTAIFRGLSQEYESFVPINPLGLQFGFRYDGGSEIDNRGGVLSVFRYVGVGRYLIQFFNQLFQHLDGQIGAHTVLLSATSFAPQSTRYHINLPVHYVICRKDNAQPSVKYVYRPGVVVSGKIGKNREEALQQQIQYLLQDDFLLHELENAPPGRKRALLLTGSYSESIFGGRYLKEYPLFKGIVYSLTKRLDPGAENWQIERQKVTEFAESGGKILFAPRAALERGLNILTPGEEGPVAAFSLIFYLVRPYPVPYDLSGMASLLNDFALRSYLCKENQRITLYEEMMNLKQQAYQMQRKFFRNSYGYRQLGEQRNKVLMDLNVSCAQIEGRLFRGPIPQPAKVFFLDASFSPRMAEGKEDSAKTSMLIGWKEVLSPSNLSHEEKKLMEILYGFRQSGLSQLEIL
jgi:pPIWI RE three-gene island domain Z